MNADEPLIRFDAQQQPAPDEDEYAATWRMLREAIDARFWTKEQITGLIDRLFELYGGKP
jgi:hypothetical protein